jgi:hypothetical protein
MAPAFPWRLCGFARALFLFYACAILATGLTMIHPGGYCWAWKREWVLDLAEHA